jgi:hypothetical protein
MICGRSIHRKAFEVRHCICSTGYVHASRIDCLTPDGEACP